MRILIVDDTPEILRGLKRLLNHEGHMVVTAVDGDDALEKLRKADDIQLIITDLCMPILDGYKFAKLAKQLTKAPIILHTGAPDVYKTPHI